MARIYSSRTLLDPTMLSTIGTATEGRIRSEAERRRNVLGAVQSMLGSAGKLVDERVDRNRADELYRKRYSDVAWQSSDEQMRDPMYRAAVEEYARTGSSAPLTQYMLGRETREANRLERERAAAEKEALERKEFELRKAQSLPRFQEAMRKFNEELDKAAPNYELAAQYQAEADALNKEFQFDERNLEAIKEAKKKTAEARAKQAAEDAALEEMGARNLAASEAAETNRQFKVTQFLATLPTTYANDRAKADAIQMILDNPDMTKEEKTEEMKKIVAIDTGTTAAKKAVQGAVAGAAGKKTEKKIEENEAKKKLADKARAKIAQGKKDFITSKEQEALNEGY